MTDGKFLSTFTSVVGLVAYDRNGPRGEIQRRDGIGFAGSAYFMLLNDTDSTAENILA
jgi:hypothetical protein